jgi:hypothetical protein
MVSGCLPQGGDHQTPIGRRRGGAGRLRAEGARRGTRESKEDARAPGNGRVEPGPLQIALRASIKAQVLHQLRFLKRHINPTYVFISHDLNVVVSNRIQVRATLRRCHPRQPTRFAVAAAGVQLRPPLPTCRARMHPVSADATGIAPGHMLCSFKAGRLTQSEIPTIIA